MRGAIVAVLVIVAMLAGAGAGYLFGSSATHSTPATTSTSPVNTIMGKEVFLLNVSGSYYWADDVTTDAVMPNPGYGYFRNGSITFDGVRFQTICPPSYQGCPGSGGNTTILLAGAINFNMTFSDGKTETTGNVIGDSIFTNVLSQHTPRAGMLVERVFDYAYPHNTVDYAVFLLVSSCGAPPNVC